MKKAVFPGSFDPFTAGHESIVRKALNLFDFVIIAIGYNSEKKGFLSLENRVELIKDVFAGEERVEVKTYDTLTVEFCKKEGVNFILRGLRTTADFEYEQAIARMNGYLDKGIETVFLLSEPKDIPVSSTIVREVLRYGGDVSKFIPEGIDIKKYM